MPTSLPKLIESLPKISKTAKELITTTSKLEASGLQYVKSADGMYVSGSILAGVVPKVMHYIYPDYYAQGKGKDGNPVKDLSNIRSYASTAKHSSTLIAGLSGSTVGAVATAGKGIDAVNLILQSYNLIDAVQNPNRSYKDVASSVFATGAAVSANLANATDHVAWLKGVMGPKTKMIFKVGNLGGNSISILLDDPTIWNKLVDESKDTKQFAENLKNFAIDSAKKMAQETWSMVKALPMDTIETLQFYFDGTLFPTELATNQQEQEAMLQWYRSEVGKKAIAENAARVAAADKAAAEKAAQDTALIKKAFSDLSWLKTGQPVKVTPEDGQPSKDVQKPPVQDTRTISDLKAGALAQVKSGQNANSKDAAAAKVATPAADKQTNAIPTIEPDGKKIPVIYPDGKKVPVLNETPVKSAVEQPVIDTRTISELKQGMLAKFQAESHAPMPKLQDLLTHDSSLDSLLGKSSVSTPLLMSKTVNELSIMQQLAKLYDLHNGS